VYLQQICNRQQNKDLKRKASKGKEKGCVCLLELIMFQFHENSFTIVCFVPTVRHLARDNLIKPDVHHFQSKCPLGTGP
jgi:hypothetical protein